MKRIDTYQKRSDHRINLLLSRCSARALQFILPFLLILCVSCGPVPSAVPGVASSQEDSSQSEAGKSAGVSTPGNENLAVDAHSLEAEQVREIVLKKSADALGSSVINLAWRPDGRGLVVIYEESLPGSEENSFKVIRHLYNVDLLTGLKEVLETSNLLWINDMAWSPDGRQLAYTEGHSLYLLDWQSRAHNLLVEKVAQGDIIDWDSSGTRIALAGEDSIGIVDARSGEILLRGTLASKSGIYQVTWNPDDDRFVAVDYDHHIWLLNTRTSSVEQNVPGHPYKAAQFSPDGTKIALVKLLGGDPSGGMLELWDAQMSAILWSVFPVADGTVTWSPDGRYIAVGSASLPPLFPYIYTPFPEQVLPGLSPTDQVPSGAAVYSASTGQIIQSLNDILYIDHLVWSPDSRWLAGAGIRINSITRESMDGDPVITVVRFDPSGEVVAISTPELSSPTARPTVDAPPSSERVLISKGGKYGYIDRYGREVIPPIFDYAENFSPDGLAHVRFFEENQLHDAFIDINGQIQLELEGYKYIYPFSDGRAMVCTEFETDTPFNLECGYLDTSGSFVIPLSERGYLGSGSERENFSQGLAVARGGTTMSGMQFGDRYIRTDGSSAFGGTRFFFASPFSEGLAAVQFSQNDGFPSGEAGLWGYIDLNGQVVIPPQYSEAHSFSDGMAVVTSPASRGLHGYIDRSGMLLVPYQFREANVFSESLAAVKKDGGTLYGYINLRGEMVIPEMFTIAGPFREGLAAVCEPNLNCGYIDATGTYAIPPIYNYVTDFTSGLAQVYDNAGNGGYINVAGEYVWKNK